MLHVFHWSVPCVIVSDIQCVHSLFFSSLTLQPLRHFLEILWCICTCIKTLNHQMCFYLRLIRYIHQQLVYSVSYLHSRKVFGDGYRGPRRYRLACKVDCYEFK